MSNGNVPPIDGWKSKWGAICLTAGGAIIAAAQVAPPIGTVDTKIWLIFLGTIISAVGTGLLGMGIAHKIQKSGTPAN